MIKLDSTHFCGISAGLLLAATSVYTPANGQESAWRKSAAEAVGPLTEDLAKAFPGLVKDGQADFNRFVTAVRAAGLGKPATPPSGAAGNAGGGRRGGGPDTSAADIEFAASLDANRDGTVTMEELRGAIESDLSKAMERKASLDTDSDGKVSKKEYAMSMPPKFGEIDEHGMDGHARGHFQQEDLDKNGELSIEEVAGPVLARATSRIRAMQLAARLIAADADHDNRLGVEELRASFGSTVDRDQSPWEALGFESDAIPVEHLYRVLSRLSREDAKALDQSLSR